MDQILVSVICPVFNRKVLIKECIDSITAQDYSNWELIVVDDNSDDGTYEYIQERSYDDNRIKVFRKEGSRGAPSSRNIGVNLSKGKYIIFLDSDDVLSACCLRERIAAMEKNKVLDFAVFPLQIFYEKPGDSKLLVNIQTKEDVIDRFLTIGQRLDVPWVICSVIWKSASIEMKNISWDEKVIVFQDIQFNVSAVITGMKYEMLEDVPTDSYWRMHDGERVGASRFLPEATESNEKLLLDIWSGLIKYGINNEKRRVRILKSILRLCFDCLIRRSEYEKANKLLLKLDEMELIKRNEKIHLLLRINIGRLSRLSYALSNYLEKKIVARNKELYKPLGAGNFLKHKVCE